jgi:hypothetical protein
MGYIGSKDHVISIFNWRGGVTALPRAITIISLALIAAARIRTKAVCGARSLTDGTGMESLRWRLDRASVDRQLLGPEGLICHADESIV